MIYDKLINMGLYKGMNKNLDTAIDFILSHDLNQLPMGKTVVDGDNVYINIIDAKAQPVEERAYEIHKNYMEIHKKYSVYPIIILSEHAVIFYIYLFFNILNCNTLWTTLCYKYRT